MNKLITQSLEEEDIRFLLDFPLELMNESEQKTVQWIQDFTIRFGEPPKIKRLCEEFELFGPRHSPDPMGDLYQRTLKRKRNQFTKNYLKSIEDDLRDGADPIPLIEKLYQTIQGRDGETLFYSTYDRSSFLRKAQSYSYEINALDKYTGGASQGDLIYVIGRLGTGKTTLTLWLVKKWLMKERRILYVSNENRADDVIAKIDAFVGGWNPLKKRTGEWTEAEKVTLRSVSYHAKGAKGEIIIPNRPITDVNKLHNLIQTYHPELVVVDGVYLMSEGGKSSGKSATWERVTDVSRNLKRIAVECAVPIVGVHQANREASGRRVEVEHAAYSDAVGQDADLILGVNSEEEENLVFVEAIKNRWGKKFGFFVKFFFEKMIVRVTDEKVVEV
jgi:KaiC/GvpD/RAD55 family RecA-like ATPase